jgi:hypothetical protein
MYLYHFSASAVYVMWLEERLWNVDALQRVLLSSLVAYMWAFTLYIHIHSLRTSRAVDPLNTAKVVCAINIVTQIQN